MQYHALIVTDLDGTPLQTHGTKVFSSKDLADQSAQDWNDYLASKGMTAQIDVITWEHNQ